MPHLEATVAADFLARLMSRRVDDQALERFREIFVRRFEEKFAASWPTPEESVRGSANRCIRVYTYRIDPFLASCLDEAKIGSSTKHLFPEVTVWIDPEAVNYRLGDHSSIMSLYGNDDSGSATDSLPSSPESTPTKGGYIYDPIVRAMLAQRMQG